MTVGSRIKERRTAIGWSRKRLARETGIPVSTLASLEYGDTHTSTSIARIASVLGVDALWLSEGLSPPSALTEAFTPDERQLLTFFRLLSRADKKVAIRIIRGLTASGEP